MREDAQGLRTGGKRWRASYDPRFERQYRRLDRKVAGRVCGAIDDLLASENVRDARDYKGRMNVDGVSVHVFARRVGRSYRILYCISGDCIRFLLVGDHKAVYGKG